MYPLMERWSVYSGTPTAMRVLLVAPRLNRGLYEYRWMGLLCGDPEVFLERLWEAPFYPGWGDYEGRRLPFKSVCSVRIATEWTADSKVDNLWWVPDVLFEPIE